MYCMYMQIYYLHGIPTYTYFIFDIYLIAYFIIFSISQTSTNAFVHVFYTRVVKHHQTKIYRTRTCIIVLYNKMDHLSTSITPINILFLFIYSGCIFEREKKRARVVLMCTQSHKRNSLITLPIRSHTQPNIIHTYSQCVFCFLCAPCRRRDHPPAPPYAQRHNVNCSK